MKPAFIQYKNLNTENNYEIYSEKGFAFDLRGAPVTNISPSQLKLGTTVNVDDDTKKIYVIPRVYDFITSGINKEFSGLKFLPTGVLNSFTVYSDKNQKYIIWRNTGLSPSMFVTGAGTVSANGTYLEDGTFNGYPRYTKSGGIFPADSIYRLNSPSNWQIGGPAPNGVAGPLYYYNDNSNLVKSPNLVPNWITNFGTNPAPNVTTTKSNGRWVLTSVDSINNTSGASFIKSNTEISVTGVYSGSGYSGTITINNIDNKLHVYNTPAISGFAGTYTSGNYIIDGISRAAFKNDTNENQNFSDFYIYKDNKKPLYSGTTITGYTTMPSIWRAVEVYSNPNFGTTTWYGVSGVDENSVYPPVTGWVPGNKPIFNTFFSVFANPLPTPEMNFGTCNGNTLIYPEYVYKAYSQDPDINKIYFYSGGALSSSGTSNLFPNNENLSDMFPDLYNTYFDRQFFYSDERYYNRYFLFKTFAKSNYEILDLWYIVKSPSSYGGSGYYYWASQDDYITGDKNNYYNSARKIYKPHGTQINNLKDITIDIHEHSLDKESPYQKDFNLQNFSGELLIKTTGNNYVNDFYKFQRINSGTFNGLTGISGQFFIFANPQFNLSGVTCGNQAFTLNPSASVFNGSGRLQFVRAREGFQFEVQFTRNLQSGWNPTGITLVPSSSQSNVPSGFIREEFYLPLSQLAGGNLFFRMRGVPAIWKILNSDYSFTNFKNCQPSANILPYSYFSTGVVSGDPFISLNYEIIPVYKHNELIDGRKMLKLDSQYNYSQVSGIFNLNTGQSFVFQFFNEQAITGFIVEKSGGDIFGSIFNIRTDNDGVTRMIINNKSKNSIYYIFRSGNASSVSKLSHDLCNIKCFIE